MATPRNILTAEDKLAVLRDRIVKLGKNQYEIELNLKFAVENNQEEAAHKLEEALAGVTSSLEFHLREYDAAKAELKKPSEDSNLHNSAE